MDDLESKIIEILKHGTPLRVAKIAAMLGVERREVNHYLYSSLKQLVVQDNDYKWSLKTNQINTTVRPSTPAPTPQTSSSQPVKQNNQYRFTKQQIKQDSSLRSARSAAAEPSPTPQTPSSQPVSHDNLNRFYKQYLQQKGEIQQPTPQKSSQPVKQFNSFQLIKRELIQASPESKVKILENAFRQEQFRELKDEQINALQLILEQAKREVSIANNAYTQGKLSSRKTNLFVIVSVLVALIGSLFFISQLLPKSNNQPSPTIPQSK